MSDRLIIKIDGDDKEYELCLNSVESKAKKTANEVQKTAKKTSEAVKSLNKFALTTAAGIGAAGAAVVGMGVK